MSPLFPARILLLVAALVGWGSGQMLDKSRKRAIVLTKVSKGEPDPGLKCHEALAESYGFISTGYAKNTTLMTCPDSNSTCCQYESQKVMIIQMMIDARNIALRFQNQDKIIFDLLSEVQLDMRYIERFKKRQAEMRMSSCKAIATKLSFHDIDHIKEELLRHRETQLEFIQRAHKGVYCAVCSPGSQRNMLMNKMVMKVSTRFCRNLVVNTIQPLMFFHHELKRFLNLLLKFMSNCDEHGSYTPDPLPEELLLEYSSNEKVVRNCWDNRNDPEWLVYCADFCTKYDTVKFAEFWEPNMETFLRLTYFLKRKRMGLNLIEKNDVMLSSDTRVKDVPLNSKVIPIIRNEEVVQDEDEVDEFHLEDIDSMKRPMTDVEMKLFMSKFNAKKVVSGDIGGQISLSDFKVIYTTKGIDFEDIGRNSVATENLLKQIETKLNSQRKLANELGGLEGGYQLDHNEKARFAMQISGGLAKLGATLFALLFYFSW